MLKFYNFIKALPYVLITFVLVVIFLPDESHLSNNTVVYASYSDVTDWDPASAFSLEILVLGNIYETLVRYDPNSSVNMIKPCLAENWSVSEDGLEWTFQLRKNVLFHDGSELTADSAKYSIERTIHKNKGGSYIWEPVQSIDVIDKYTLKISTKYLAPIDLIASSQYAAYIYSPATKKLGEDWFNQGKASGTGPYKLRQWNRNQQIVIEQNDNYEVHQQFIKDFNGDYTPYDLLISFHLEVNEPPIPCWYIWGVSSNSMQTDWLKLIPFNKHSSEVSVKIEDFSYFQVNEAWSDWVQQLPPLLVPFADVDYFLNYQNIINPEFQK